MRNRLFTITGFVILGVGLLFFCTRGFFLRKVLEKTFSQVMHAFNIEVSYTNAGFTGFKTIYICGLKILSDKGDTIVKADSIFLNPRLLPLLVGKKRLKELAIYNTDIHLNVNLLRLLKSHCENVPKDTTGQPSFTNYAQLLNSLQNKFFTFIPTWVIIRNSEIVYRRDSIISSVYCNNFNYQNNSFLGDLVLTDNHIQGRCVLEGLLDPSARKMTASLNHVDTSLVQLPYINARWKAFIGFDTLRFSISFKKINTNLTTITGDAFASHLALQHKSLGPDEVTTQSGSIHYSINVGNRYAELDSSTIVRVNGFSFSPYARFENYNSRKLTFAFIRKEFDAQELFESLPSGLLSNFDGIETKGRLAYHLKVTLNFDYPDSVLFDSKLENKDFTIKKYGVTDFRIMNSSFVQSVYDKGRYVESILVGPENPDFVAIQNISPYLKFSILTAEDGDFFYHRGFNQNAFRESITTNLKEHRFARGGSTISMQLVKNIFLRGDKTISRKLEEALIVWIIENLHLVSKERMFEVYLNIIEMGPGVYGIKRASKFYFNKLPSDLNLNESIYLSSIIPRPKAFRYTFISNGVLRDYLTSYYKLLGGTMVRRNQISPFDTINLKPNIKLTGEASMFLAQPDSSAHEDSLFYMDAKNLIPE